ncbi:MAG: threonine ammonia-lyase, partial [Acidimicrobiia bacterium]
LLGLIAEEGANIVGIEHRREGPQVKHFGEVEVIIEVETRGADEMRRLERRLTQDGYAIERI